MDEAKKADLIAAIRAHGAFALSEGLCEQSEIDTALAAAERDDEREARRFFLTLLARESEAWDL